MRISSYLRVAVFAAITPVFAQQVSQPGAGWLKRYDNDLELNNVSETLSVADEKGNRLKKAEDSIPVKVALTVTGVHGGN